ncbi:hypothetical protein B4166_3375 [Caldibacillus thermoamylovorans]|nr:hypothetical protein B4166_3375 [Caldibacillus thermoamylovorans]
MIKNIATVVLISQNFVLHSGNALNNKAKNKLNPIAETNLLSLNVSRLLSKDTTYFF